MADDYVFNDHTDAEKVREAIEQGTDPNGRPILRNVVETASEFAEDTTHSDGDKGTSLLAVRNDTLASLVDTDGDYSVLQVNSDGALYVSDVNAITPAENGIEIYGSDDGGTTQRVIATDQSGQPQVDVQSQPARAAGTDSVEAVESTDSAVYGGSEYVVQQAHIDVSSSGTNQIVGAPGSGTRIVVLSWEVTTDTAHKVTLQDGAGTPNVLDVVYAGQNSGAVKDPTGPVGETADNVALNANLDGANNTSVRVSYITV